jgi:hypothetical protein
VQCEQLLIDETYRSASFLIIDKSKKSRATLKSPAAHDWRTTDADEINKSRLRAREESFVITNTTPAHPIFSNFRVKSGSGLTYSVEIRD